MYMYSYTGTRRLRVGGEVIGQKALGDLPDHLLKQALAHKIIEQDGKKQRKG